MLPRRVLPTQSPTFSRFQNFSRLSATAGAGTLPPGYVYDAKAVDPDQDLLTYSLASAPQTMQINPTTGTIWWNPAPEYVGQTVSVRLRVEDGNGGVAEQAYSILVHEAVGNHPPVIISSPITHYTIPGESSPSGEGVSPNQIDLSLAPGALSQLAISYTVQIGAGISQVPGWQLGDILVSTGNGYILQYHSDGTYVGTLYTGIDTLESAGMAFDSSGRLFVTNFQASNITLFNNDASILSPNPYINGDDFSSNESIIFDSDGNILVGQSDGSCDVLKFSPDGTLLDQFDVATQDRGSDWIDLAADGRTLYYTSEGDAIKRYDLATHTQLPDFAEVPTEPNYTLRILPDGGVLVAGSSQIYRYSSDGQLL